MFFAGHQMVDDTSRLSPPQTPRVMAARLRPGSFARQDVYPAERAFEDECESDRPTPRSLAPPSSTYASCRSEPWSEDECLLRAPRTRGVVRTPAEAPPSPDITAAAVLEAATPSGPFAAGGANADTERLDA